MDTPITRAEHEEFVRRMDSENARLADEDARQNKRLDILESSVRDFGSLAALVEKLATNMESMCKVQEQQGKRLETLENRDGEKWRKAAGYAVTAVIWYRAGVPVPSVWTIERSPYDE